MKYSKLITKKYGEYVRDISALGNPLLLLLISFIFLEFRSFWIVVLGLLINEFVGSFIKFVFPKKRPDKQKYSNSLEKIDAGSFPSIHSSRIMFIYLSLLFSTNVLAYRFIFTLVIVAVGYSRTFLKKHYWVDVLGGWVFGSLIYYLSTLF